MKSLLILFFLIGLNGCGKIDLPEEEAPVPTVPDRPDNPDTPDTPVTPPAEGDVLTVAQALKAEQDTDYDIEGFIVGYVSGTSLNKGAHFELPEESPNTNMLLADRPEECNPQLCIAVKLEKSGGYATREALNLLDHPELFQKKIRIWGWISNYFGKNGISRIFGYEVKNYDPDNNNDSGGDDDHKGDNDGEIEPPILDPEEEFVPEGRSAQRKLSGPLFPERTN